jgi:hypothetical protein
MSKVSTLERNTLERRAYEIVGHWGWARSIVSRAMDVPFRASEDFWMDSTLEQLVGSLYAETLATVETLAKHEAEREKQIRKVSKQW